MVHSVAFSPNGQRLASASSDQTVKVWETVSGKELLTLKGHTGTVSSVAFSPDGQRLASASLDGTVKLWEAVHVPLQILRQRALHKRAFKLIKSLFAARRRRPEVMQALRDDPQVPGAPR